jgi:hypothetical protein
MPNGAIHKVAHEQRDVLRAFPQRRQAHREYIQAIIEISPELAVHHHLRQIATRVIVTKLGRAVVHVTHFIATVGLIYHSLQPHFIYNLLSLKWFSTMAAGRSICWHGACMNTAYE